MEHTSSDVMSEVITLIHNWEEEHAQPNYDPVPTLTKLAEIIEVETENYLKTDPDPFDERHPSRTDPNCNLGQILKALFRKDNFMNKFVSDYLRDTYYSRNNVQLNRDVDQLNIAACRLMLDIMPGLETSVVFQQRDHLHISLQSHHGVMRPKHPQHQEEGVSRENGVSATLRPPAIISPEKPLEVDQIGANSFENNDEQPRKKMKLSISPIRSPNGKVGQLFSETSNSSWAELESFMIGSIQIFPPTLATRQILILRYLTPMGEYQEFLSHVFENQALELVLSYVNVKETKEARLAFEALKYLAALLCHKKFSIEFINCRGLETLLDVPRPSIAATGVSMCLYYLGYCEEAMERVCLLPKYIVSRLVNYALWLLECSHDSGRCHATMFFGLTFQFKIILEEFDSQDGLRKLHNVISTLPNLSSEDSPPIMNEDAECAARQIVRHVCVAYKRYLEAHLYAKVEQIRRSQLRPNERSVSTVPTQPSYKACKSSPEEIQQQIDTLLQSMPFRAHWPPVDQLLKLGGITLLLKIIAFAYEWNYSGRAETVRSALDVLAIACVIPKVQLLFCDRVDLPEETITVGINIILGAADGEIVADADVQKAALRVLVNCVCAPVNRVGGTVARFSVGSTSSPSKKTKVKSSEELIQKIWESVRANSGIMVFLQLMNVKTPITDADCIRTLACKALAGLARSETVRQIVSKLPMFTNGHLQNLMRDPILQEKRQEHVLFQKYALELLGRLSGKAKHTGKDLDVSLVNIHRANVVAQTKIQFNDRQLLQLIQHHLASRGLSETAALLQKEAHLSSAVTPSSHPPNKFRYASPVTPNRVRLSFSSPMLRSTPSVTTQQHLIEPTVTTPGSKANAVKIIKKSVPTPNSTPQNSRLQKQISSDPHVKIVMPSTEDGSTAIEPRITLDSIITEYLTNQHALCKNPMATCPQFNLFVPHKCPDPKPRITTANNFVMRSARRQMGYNCKSMDRKLIHSRFCPVQTIRLPSDDGFFTCARFMPGDQTIVVGDYSGQVRFFNTNTGECKSTDLTAHDNCVVHLEPSWDGKLLLTSSTWGKPLSALFAVRNMDIDMKQQFDDDYVEFSKVTQDRVIGTSGVSATIYDVATGREIQRWVPSISNQYTKNKATFSHTDELVLSDGVLFDVASGKQIHKLDKLNQTQSGVFHPNGLEIVSNTEVWDIRTFHLLRTVPALNQCQVLFTSTNSAIYAIAMEQEVENDTTFDSSFKTIDASDYSSIATIDVKRNIYDLAVNVFDTQIAIVENQGLYHSVQESVVRLYDVGRRRDDEDEQEEEDDEEDMDESDDDASDTEGPIIMEVGGPGSGDGGGDDENNENGGNNEGGDGEEDNDDDGNGSDSDSWTDVSGDSDDSFGNDSSGLSDLEELLFSDY
ncbi:vprbp protein-related [Holotrichia oblita]|uniref:Vprbp protein-related n=1 Tax=Holotrichia oblita TaxID=644536 RepID=A0ACB9TGB5_HOLOL|nr:vprbp protein-related [Holotrichia oblita]